MLVQHNVRGSAGFSFYRRFYFGSLLVDGDRSGLNCTGLMDVCVHICTRTPWSPYNTSLLLLNGSEIRRALIFAFAAGVLPLFLRLVSERAFDNKKEAAR